MFDNKVILSLGIGHPAIHRWAVVDGTVDEFKTLHEKSKELLRELVYKKLKVDDSGKICAELLTVFPEEYPKDRPLLSISLKDCRI